MIRVRVARPTDVDSIFAIADSWALGVTEPNEVAATGFLLLAFSKDDFVAFVETADHFYVAEGSVGVIIGFVLAYSSKLIDPQKAWTDSLLGRTFQEPFVIVRQVAVEQTHVSRGVGTALYECLQAAVECPIYAAVAAEPRNEPSERFHRKMGFEPVLRSTAPSDDIPRAIWRYCRDGTS